MRVFLYEWITGGGLVEETGSLPQTMLAEGSAMIGALAADFAKVPGCEVTLLRDMRLMVPAPASCEIVEVHSASDHRVEFDRLAAAAEHTLVVAPEFDDILRRTVRWVIDAGGRPLNASDEFIALAADKHRTAEHLRQSGSPAPFGRLVEADADKLPADFEYPAVLKPVDGAGSQHTLLVAGPRDEPPPYPWQRRLERYCPGRAASVAALCGEGSPRILPPCWQHLSADGRFTYLGGSLIGEGSYVERATKLAQQALAAMPPAKGYVGVDLVLGNSPHGDEDFVIEINPRLTTSYVGLRAALRENLAQSMLEVIAGRVPELTRRGDALEFSADGRVWAKL